MGIYPRERRVTEPVWNEEWGQYLWIEERDTYDGAKYRREVTATKWEEHSRETCYCCSCDDSHDPYCRNHGFAGSRTCETHKIRGSGIDGEYFSKVPLKKLLTVQQMNRLHRAKYDSPD